jgi:hypothetical protein
VVGQFRQKLMVFTHHPVCAAKDATQLFLDRAATPPRRGGEKCATEPKLGLNITKSVQGKDLLQVRSTVYKYESAGR